MWYLVAVDQRFEICGISTLSFWFILQCDTNESIALHSGSKKINYTSSTAVRHSKAGL